MSKQNFHTLLKRYRNGSCTAHERQLVEQWFMLLGEEARFPDDEAYDLIEERIWNALKVRRGNPDNTRRLHPRIWKWVAAAVVILGAGFMFYREISPSPKEPFSAGSGKLTEQQLVTRTNTSAKTRKLQLPDGSEVRLSPGGSVSYPAAFKNRRREVFLEGRAFFKVVHNPEEPFLVHAGDLITRVLGTSFWVDQNAENSDVEVSVVTGKVAVSARSEADTPETGKVRSGVILTANQRVKFNNENHAFETGLVMNPVLITPPGKKASEGPAAFVFEDAPLEEVIRRLENAYGIEIILENEALRSCLFTANITEQPLFTKLDMLCASFNASYEIRGTRILISGKGCETDH